MKIVILGGSGATGRLVVMQLRNRQIKIRLVLREGAILPAEISADPLVEIIRGNISEFDDRQLSALLQDCDAVVSCLGHNISFKGLFGKPRNLVSDTIKNICRCVEAQGDKKIKLILMSTTAYTNYTMGKKSSFVEKMLFLILKLILPPHRDNVRAADYLLKTVGKDNSKIEWTAVRPDTLINDEAESPTDVRESPVRSPLFDPGKTSRINVSRFMADLLLDEKLWKEWRYRMPVVYNKEPGTAVFRGQQIKNANPVRICKGTLKNKLSFSRCPILNAIVYFVVCTSIFS